MSTTSTVDPEVYTGRTIIDAADFPNNTVENIIIRPQGEALQLGYTGNEDATFRNIGIEGPCNDDESNIFYCWTRNPDATVLIENVYFGGGVIRNNGSGNISFLNASHQGETIFRRCNIQVTADNPGEDMCYGSPPGHPSPPKPEEGQGGRVWWEDCYLVDWGSSETSWGLRFASSDPDIHEPSGMRNVTMIANSGSLGVGALYGQHMLVEDSEIDGVIKLGDIGRMREGTPADRVPELEVINSRVTGGDSAVDYRNFPEGEPSLTGDGTFGDNPDLSVPDGVPRSVEEAATGESSRQSLVLSGASASGSEWRVTASNNADLRDAGRMDGADVINASRESAAGRLAGSSDTDDMTLAPSATVTVQAEDTSIYATLDGVSITVEALDSANLSPVEGEPARIGGISFDTVIRVTPRDTFEATIEEFAQEGALLVFPENTGDLPADDYVILSNDYDKIGLLTENGAQTNLVVGPNLRQYTPIVRGMPYFFMRGFNYDHSEYDGNGSGLIVETSVRATIQDVTLIGGIADGVDISQEFVFHATERDAVIEAERCIGESRGTGFHTGGPGEHDGNGRVGFMSHSGKHVGLVHLINCRVTDSANNAIYAAFLGPTGYYWVEGGIYEHSYGGNPRTGGNDSLLEGGYSEVDMNQSLREWGGIYGPDEKGGQPAVRLHVKNIDDPPSQHDPATTLRDWDIRMIYAHPGKSADAVRIQESLKDVVIENVRVYVGDDIDVTAINIQGRGGYKYPPPEESGSYAGYNNIVVRNFEVTGPGANNSPVYIGEGRSGVRFVDCVIPGGFTGPGTPETTRVTQDNVGEEPGPRPTLPPVGESADPQREPRKEEFAHKLVVYGSVPDAVTYSFTVSSIDDTTPRIYIFSPDGGQDQVSDNGRVATGTVTGGTDEWFFDGRIENFDLGGAASTVDIAIDGNYVDVEALRQEGWPNDGIEGGPAPDPEEDPRDKPTTLATFDVPDTADTEGLSALMVMRYRQQQRSGG